MKRLILVFCLLATSLCATSLKLFNDSPYKLRAVVRAADGTYLGETILLSQSYYNWTDTYSQFGLGGYQGPSAPSSRTPYTVSWYCLSGDEYSICTNVPSGGLVTPQIGEGARICKPPPKSGAQVGPKGEELNYQNVVPDNPYHPNSPNNPDNPNSPDSPMSPYNPDSPYNPSNPESPYNPNNPKSPYYKKPQQAPATGSNPGSPADSSTNSQGY